MFPQMRELTQTYTFEGVTSAPLDWRGIPVGDVAWVDNFAV